MNDNEPYTFATEPKVVMHKLNYHTTYPCGCKTTGFGTSIDPVRIIFCPVHSKAHHLRDALRNLCNSATLITNRAKAANTRAANLLALITTR